MYKIIIWLISMQILTIWWIALYAENFFVWNGKITELRQAPWQYSFINPLLECWIDIEYNNTRRIQREVNNYIQEVIWEGRADNISYFVRVLNNQWTFWYDFDREYTPASLIKLPLAMAVVKNIPLELLSETVIIWDDLEVLQRNIWDEKTQIWWEYTIRELIENMLIYSDNIATEALFLLLWDDIINTVYRDLNLDPIDFDNMHSGNISPKQYAWFFRILYNASYIWHNRSEYILRVLSWSDFKDGISWSIPKFIRVSNKFWERSYIDSAEKQLHDCGIIYAQNSPYVICIMTSWDDHQNLSDIIKEISSIIYTQLL